MSIQILKKFDIKKSFSWFVFFVVLFQYVFFLLIFVNISKEYVLKITESREIFICSKENIFYELIKSMGFHENFNRSIVFVGLRENFQDIVKFDVSGKNVQFSNDMSFSREVRNKIIFRDGTGSEVIEFTLELNEICKCYELKISDEAGLEYYFLLKQG